MRCTILIGTLLVCALPDRGAAQDTPEAAAAAFGDAMRANDWATTARLMHPAALHQLKTLFEPIIEAAASEDLDVQVFGVHSSAEYLSTPDTVLFASFLQYVVTRENGIGEAMRTAVITPLGHVAQGPDTMLVVSRITVSVKGMTISQFDVMPFVYDQGRWWGILKADFTNMAAMLQQALGTRKS